MVAQNTTSVPLTLIVAATSRSYGIGKNGKLPWPMLKQEMAYFKRVTSKPPTNTQGAARCKNAVIMGKRTWESIPEKFRPLKGRVNVIVSKTLLEAESAGKREILDAVNNGTSDGPVIVKDLDEAVSLLHEGFADADGGRDGRLRIHVAYVIGGAMLYKNALSHPNVRRVLLTKIHSDYDCDTWFPIDMDSKIAKTQGWKKCGIEELDEATGEGFEQDQSKAQREEAGVKFEFCLYEKEREGD